MFIKNLFLLLITSALLCQVCYADHNINAKNNAYRHNNKGLMYLQDNYYYGAIKEFQIAIDLSPDTQASAVYYVNLANTYEKIGYPNLARPCYEKALSLNAFCFDYYLKLAENYKKLNVVSKKLDDFIKDKRTPLNDIMIGLLYIQNGDISTGITVLDEFCNNEPKLVVTAGVRAYLDKLTSEKSID
ncbi:hypothetical protein IJD44_03925 [bacterium]|nr:hypothetical protein [bacterium]